jgi:tetratricopeptide (TPR) repeat protein
MGLFDLFKKKKKSPGKLAEELPIVETHQVANVSGGMNDRKNHMTIIRCARGTEIQRHQQRIFISWNPADIELRKKLVTDLLWLDRNADFVISWLEYSEDEIRKAEESVEFHVQHFDDENVLQQELNDTQLFIGLVTLIFLTHTRPMEFQLAIKMRKLVNFPIAANSELLSSLGEVHGLAMDDKEYIEKLRTHVNYFIASSKLINRINENAFSGRVFFSYRKIDIDLARQFMKDFHGIPGCEKIAVWYDNYLIVGEQYDQEIKENIAAADLFIMLVTPNLFQKNYKGETNYVMASEYPEAIRLGKPILLVMVDGATNANGAEQLAFKDHLSVCMPRMVSSTMNLMLSQQDAILYALGLSNIVDKNVPVESLVPAQLYYLGEAYFHGYLVEQNKSMARKLFALAAKRDTEESLEATTRLAVLSRNFSRLIDNVHDNIEAIKMATMMRTASGTTPMSQLPLEMLQAMMNPGAEAVHWMGRALEIANKLYGPEAEKTITCCNRLAMLYLENDEPQKALHFYNIVVSYVEKKWKPVEIALIYVNMGVAYCKFGDHTNASIYLTKAYEMLKELLGPDDENTVSCGLNLGTVYAERGELKKALTLFEEHYNYCIRKYGVQHAESARSKHNIGLTYRYLGQLDKAEEFLQDAWSVLYNCLGALHPMTKQTLNHLNEVKNLKAGKNS